MTTPPSRPEATPAVRRRTALAAVGAAAGLIVLGAPCASRAAGNPEAAQPIQALDQALLGIMRQGSAGAAFSSRYNALLPVVQRAFNLPFVLQEVVGLAYAAMTEAQKQSLLRAFTAFTVATYVANFDGYDGQSFAVSPDQRMAGPDVIVNTRIVPRTGSPTAIDYVMRQGPQGWQAIDVLLDGTISRAATQRSDFTSILGGPGGVDALIRSLDNKVRSLSGGTISP